MLTVEKSGGKYRLIEGGKNKISYLVITIGGGGACLQHVQVSEPGIKSTTQQ